MAKDIFITEDFLLQNRFSRLLYHDFADNMPLIDYHCHLQPREIAEDSRWENITLVWLNGDHYKWRAMRSNGVEERYCTGDASDREKFQKWAMTVPFLLRNPLYHWTHLELKRYFGISDRLLSPETAESIWNECNECIAERDFSARGLITRSNVEIICTTDDPTDSLEYHRALAAEDGFGVRVLPAWRPDRAMAAEKPEIFNGWVDRLSEASDVEINGLDSYMEAIKRRHEYFHDAGCRLSDHGMETFPAADYTRNEIESLFENLRSGKRLSDQEIEKFRSAMLYDLGIMNAERGWVQQFHYGCMRNTNSRMFEQLGPDAGFDSIGDYQAGPAMAKFFDRLDRAGKLAKTVIYNLNPCDNELVASMLGNFQDGSVPGKMQMGSGWWFMDQSDGIARQVEALSQLGLLSRFVGMLTDSRSFLSYTRHEYFRRILCNILGRDMEKGLIPRDMELVGNMVRDICYNNARSYFGL